MSNSNSGYSGWSMSNRAIQARNEGELPKTDFKKIYGIDPSQITSHSSWHHTSKHFNKTFFYSIEDLMNELAEMKFDERIKIIGKGKFLKYWNENKAYYLLQKLDRKIESKLPPFKVSKYNFGIPMSLVINDMRQWGRAFRKAIADGIRFYGCDVRLSQSGQPNFFHVVKK